MRLPSASKLSNASAAVSTLFDTMRAEHCEKADCHEPYKTGNYAINTSSTIEFWFVVDPDNKLEELAARESSKNLLCRNGQPAEWPPEHETRDGKEELTRNVQGRGKCRLSTPLALVDVSRRRKNEELRKVGVEQGISVEEMIAARLYTGPCVHPTPTSHPTLHHPSRCGDCAAQPPPAPGPWRRSLHQVQRGAERDVGP